MLNKSKLINNYIELLKKSLTNELYIENEVRIINALFAALNKLKISAHEIYNINHHPGEIDFLAEIKLKGNVHHLNQIMPDGSMEIQHWTRNITELSHTMIGKKRLDNIQYCVETILDEDISGDLIETGIWRGGAVIFMRGLLAAYSITDRFVWAADSFEGVPTPSLPEDAGFEISAKVLPFLAVSIEDVMDLFDRYDLLDEQVNFIQGWFKDTLATAPIEKLAMLRLDGDLYESTMDALVPLYDKVSRGGFIIVDDYFSCPPCKQAIDEFRVKHAITDELMQIDGQSVFWRKSGDK
jgi:hypothetical protein